MLQKVKDFFASDRSLKDKAFPVGLAVVVALVAIVAIQSVVTDGSTSRQDRDSVSVSVDETAAASPSVSKYTQTWSKDYASTTCAQWRRAMSDEQQFAAAADILTAARNKIDGGTGLPSDSLIIEFQGGITTSCVIPKATLTDITYLLYNTEPRFEP